MQRTDELADLGKFDDAISGDLRDRYTGMAIIRRQQPVQCLGGDSNMPRDETKHVFMVYRHEEIELVLRRRALAMQT
jgi:hypothetical protein